MAIEQQETTRWSCQQAARASHCSLLAVEILALLPNGTCSQALPCVYSGELDVMQSIATLTELALGAESCIASSITTVQVPRSDVNVPLYLRCAFLPEC